MSHKIRRGFTLIEVVVVLAILAMIASVAVTSLEGAQDQTRYDTTKQTMENVQEAVIGPANLRAADGTATSSGFVADIGRLPKATALKNPDNSAVVKADGTAAFDLLELASNPYNLAPFGMRQVAMANITTPASPTPNDEDLEVFIPCGWRGPYVRLGVGQSTLKDGWGNFFDLLNTDRSYCGDGVPVQIIRSRGSNAAELPENARTNDLREDLYVNFATLAFDGSATAPKYPATAAIDQVTASTVTVVLSHSDSATTLDPATVVVKCYGPDPISGKIKVSTFAAQTAVAQNSITYLLSDPTMAVGPHIIRAYKTNGALSPNRSAPLQVSFTPIASTYSLKVNW